MSDYISMYIYDPNTAGHAHSIKTEIGTILILYFVAFQWPSFFVWIFECTYYTQLKGLLLFLIQKFLSFFFLYVYKLQDLSKKKGCKLKNRLCNKTLARSKTIENTLIICCFYKKNLVDRKGVETSLPESGFISEKCNLFSSKVQLFVEIDLYSPFTTSLYGPI